jgi:UTP15 C terminal
MSDGLVSVSRRLEESEKVQRVPKLKYSYKEWDKVLKQTPQLEPLQKGDTNFDDSEKKLLSHIDRHLSSYRYSKALEVAMTQYIVKRKPEVIVTLMQELIRFAAKRISFELFNFNLKFAGERDCALLLLARTNESLSG